MKRAAVGLGLMLAVLASPAVAEPDGAASPFSAMRRLQILQEQIAHGNSAAQVAQPKLMAHIAERFLSAPPDVWREPRNARAAVLFLLSGGKPAVIRAVLAKATLPHEYDDLIKGALAYGEADDATARKLLGGIDPRSVPSVLGGHLALVQATLLSNEDSAKAGKLLDLARLLVPGTLVEEAALRRQIFLLAGPATFDKFVFLSREYVRRFRNSVYADNFKQRLATIARELASAGDVADLSKFDEILRELPPEEQLASYLTTARVALVQGKAEAARAAAEKAAALAGEQSADGIRSKLYAGAALIVSDESGAGLRALQAIEPSRLSREDAELRDAAMAVAAGVRSEVSEADHDVVVGPANVVPSDGPALQTIAAARGALADADKLIQGAER